MKTFWRILVLIIGAAMGALLVIWLLNGRRIPSLRFSHTLGGDSRVDIEWIQIR